MATLQEKEELDNQKKLTPEYQEGENAFALGEPDNSSSYLKGTNEYSLWITGWITAKINSRVGHILEKYNVGKL
jgi:hypothetical protein